MPTRPSWAPSASISTLAKRAVIMEKIRRFFSQRNILEVETPAMSRASVTDVHLHTFQLSLTQTDGTGTTPFYLITSPEYHMKRLLAAGSGPIFQLCKSFRNGESGKLHNPEFTLLEWYQFGPMQALMAAVEDLLRKILRCDAAKKCSYQQIFQHHLAVDPLTVTIKQLQAAAAPFNLSAKLIKDADHDTLLQLLFSVAIEPHIGVHQPIFVYHFPASQAALAQVSCQDPRVAERFEVYYRGLELANGFHELRDATEQSRRFQEDNRQREKRGLPVQPIDQHLLAALRHGLPECSGVAIGIDRLLMLALGEPRIQGVMAFDTGIA